MAFPVVAASNTTADTSSASITVAMPSGIVAGNLLMVFVAQDANGTITQSGATGWTKLEQTNNGTVCGLAIFAKIAAGGDTLTLVSTNSQDAACISVRITGHGVTNVATEITRGVAATGLSATPDPPNCNPGVARDYLWLEVFAADDDDDTATYWSTNYTGVAQVKSAASTSSCLLALARRALNAASENPGAMAMALSEEWVAQTLAILPDPNVVIGGTGVSAGVSGSVAAAVSTSNSVGVSSSFSANRADDSALGSVVGLSVSVAAPQGDGAAAVSLPGLVAGGASGTGDPVQALSGVGVSSATGAATGDSSAAGGATGRAVAVSGSPAVPLGLAISTGVSSGVAAAVGAATGVAAAVGLSGADGAILGSGEAVVALPGISSGSSAAQGAPAALCAAVGIVAAVGLSAGSPGALAVCSGVAAAGMAGVGDGAALARAAGLSVATSSAPAEVAALASSSGVSAGASCSAAAGSAVIAAHGLSAANSTCVGVTGNTPPPTPVPTSRGYPVRRRR